MPDADAVFFETPAAFEAWLDVHGEEADGVWIKMAKKGSGIASLDLKGAINVALCFGWIDAKGKRIDDDWYMLRFTPRRPQSTWSKRNREKVAALTAAGRMRPAGLAEVARAKSDGRWDAAYDGMATASVPEDLAQALNEADLGEAFSALDSRNRYAILHRIQTAKRPEPRARQIANYVSMLASGEKPYP
jgi:uncharacterized protein YdeI (YjbR/CyaY-like superfamily)